VANPLKDAWTSVKAAARTASRTLLGDGSSVDASLRVAAAAESAQGLAKGRQVNLFTEGWSAISGTTRVPRYQFGITFVWTDNAGVDHQCQQMMIFPDALLALGEEALTGRIQEWLIEIARQDCGVDTA